MKLPGWMKKVGRPRNAKRDEYAGKFGLTERQRDKYALEVLEQYERCRDEAAVRLLLGKGRKK